MKFHDFSPFYRSSEGIKPKVSGDRLLDNPLVADVQSGASYRFDGGDDWVVVPNDANLNFGTGDFSAELWFKRNANESYAGNPEVLLNNAGASQSQQWQLSINSSNGIYPYLTDGSNTFDGRTGGVAATGYDDGDWHHVCLSYDRGSTAGVQLFIDGVLKASGNGTSVGNLTTADDFRIGGYYTATYDFKGEIRQVRLYNRALTAAEVRAAYSGQAVPFEYVGASQTDKISSTLVNNGSYPFNTFQNASANGFEAVKNASGTKVASTADEIAVEAGKKYRIKFDVTLNSGTYPLTRLRSTATSGTWATVVVAGGAANGESVEFDWVSTLTDTLVLSWEATSNVDFAIANLSMRQIGCVAEYLPTGINSTRWMDTSGNGLHGSTSTATAVNHKIGSLTLATLSTDAVRFDSASGTTTSSTLDHFEQGTWAPVLSDGTNNATMHANNIGTYTRIGSTVFVNAQVMVSSLGSVSGNVRITGLPYQPATTGTTVRNYWAAASVTHGWSLAVTANQSVGGFIRDNLSYIELRLWDATGGTTELQHSEVTADGELMIHAMYYC